MEGKLYFVHLFWGFACQDTITFKDKQLCKFFKTGDHVKVVTGKHEGVTGMVVKVEAHILVVLSDTTKEDVSSVS